MNESGPEDYFAVFNLKPGLRVDEAGLKQFYISAHRRLKPDFFTGKDPAAELQKLELAERLDRAYRVLMDPVQRLVAYFEQTCDFQQAIWQISEQDIPEEWLQWFGRDPVNASKTWSEEAGEAFPLCWNGLRQEIRDFIGRLPEGQEPDCFMMLHLYKKARYLLGVRESLDNFAG